MTVGRGCGQVQKLMNMEVVRILLPLPRQLPTAYCYLYEICICSQCRFLFFYFSKVSPTAIDPTRRTNPAGLQSNHFSILCNECMNITCKDPNGLRTRRPSTKVRVTPYSTIAQNKSVFAVVFLKLSVNWTRPLESSQGSRPPSTPKGLSWLYYAILCDEHFPLNSGSLSL